MVGVSGTLALATITVREIVVAYRCGCILVVSLSTCDRSDDRMVDREIEMSITPVVTRALIVVLLIVVLMHVTLRRVGGEDHWREIIDQYSWDAEVAERVMMCESEGDAAAVNGVYVGLFQIDSVLHRWSREELLVPEVNIAAAFEKYRERGWQPWPECSIIVALPGTGHGLGNEIE